MSQAISFGPKAQFAALRGYRSRAKRVPMSQKPPRKLEGARVALIHDWLLTYAGAERVADIGIRRSCAEAGWVLFDVKGYANEAVSDEIVEIALRLASMQV